MINTSFPRFSATQDQPTKAEGGDHAQAGAMASSSSGGALSPASASALQTFERHALEMLAILMMTFQRRLIRQQITPDVLAAALDHGWLAETKGPGRWDRYYVPAGHLAELVGRDAPRAPGSTHTDGSRGATSPTQ